jgi:hypothetical protein
VLDRQPPRARYAGDAPRPSLSTSLTELLVDHSLNNSAMVSHVLVRRRKPRAGRGTPAGGEGRTGGDARGSPITSRSCARGAPWPRSSSAAHPAGRRATVHRRRHVRPARARRMGRGVGASTRDRDRCLPRRRRQSPASASWRRASRRGRDRLLQDMPLGGERLTPTCESVDARAAGAPPRPLHAGRQQHSVMSARAVVPSK